MCLGGIELKNFGIEGDLGVEEINDNGTSSEIGLDIRAVHYLDIFKKVSSFVSLDISVRSTGWCKWKDGELAYGTFSLKEEDDVQRRKLFRDFLIDLCSDCEYEYLIIEDVIGSINFKTAKILYQLNPIPDDLVSEGVLHVKEIIRENNKTWKKNLRQCAEFTAKYVASKNDKEIVRECMNKLGFGTSEDGISEDVYDALGMAVGVIFARTSGKVSRGKKLKTDIRKGYKIEQFDDLHWALDFANDLGGYIHTVDYTDTRKELKALFKKLVEEVGDDKVFVISIPTSKLGSVGLEKGLDLDIDISHLVIYRKK